jgi:Rieske Fe-S protein
MCMMKRFFPVMLSALALVAVPGCRDRRENILPQSSFSIYININEPAFFDLTVPSGWIYYGGNTVDLIIYRNTMEEFTALDARSTHEIEEGCMVQVMEDNVIIEDPCSGSQWLLQDGSVINGPAAAPLIRYENTFNASSGVLHIFN